MIHRAASHLVAALLMSVGATCAGAAGPEALAARRDDGIWKSAIPPHGMKGEFDNHDPIGLAAGALIKTDCALNWVDPDDRKLYCFNSATAVEYFRQWPKANVRARGQRGRQCDPHNEPGERREEFAQTQGMDGIDRTALQALRKRPLKTLNRGRIDACSRRRSGMCLHSRCS